MDILRGAMVVVLIRAVGAIGLLAIAIYNFATGDYAVAVLWAAVGLLFAVMAIYRFRGIMAGERKSETGRE